jgi:hypothetical protein
LYYIYKFNFLNFNIIKKILIIFLQKSFNKMGLGKSKITNEQNFSHVFFNQLIALNSLGLCNPNIFGYNYFCSLGQYANRGPILNCIYYWSYIFSF